MTGNQSEDPASTSDAGHGAAAVLMRRKNWLWFAVRGGGSVLLRLFFQLRVDGTENLPSRSAFVLLPKHQCWQDIPLLGWATPRPLYYIAKAELFGSVTGRWFIQSMGGIPINRQRPMETRRSLSTAVNLLENGEGLVVFPEGTYFRNCMGPGRPGMIKYLFSHTRVAHVPVGIQYHRRRPRRVRVDIRFGKALDPAEFRSPLDLTAQVMDDIAHLSGFTCRRVAQAGLNGPNGSE